MSEQLERDIAEVLNRHSAENGSNTPDFILAEYLLECLEAFNRASRAREKWYGKELRIGSGEADQAVREEATANQVCRERVKLARRVFDKVMAKSAGEGTP